MHPHPTKTTLYKQSPSHIDTQQMGVLVPSVSPKSPDSHSALWDLLSVLPVWGFLEAGRKLGWQCISHSKSPSPPPAFPPYRVWQKLLQRGLCVAGNNTSLFWHRREGLLFPLWMPLWEEDLESVAPQACQCPPCPQHVHATVVPVTCSPEKELR